MLTDQYRVILASGSTRRRDLLMHITPEFEHIVSSADETLPENIGPGEAVSMLSSIKAESVAEGVPAPSPRSDGVIIIGADTVVFADSKIMGKPADINEAREMLQIISNSIHWVYTGVTIIVKTASGSKKRTFTSCTEVHVAPLSNEEIEEYLATGESMGKAGAYAIQGGFSKFVTEIHGDYANVVGLPVSKLYSELKEMLAEE